MLSNASRLILRSKLFPNGIINTVIRCSSNDAVNMTYLEIPVYPVDKAQPLKQRKARLLYQSRKRGMLENCLLLSTFAKKHLDNFSEEQTLLYDRLINSPSNDWDIFYWMIGKKPTPQDFDNEIMDLLKQHAKNNEKVARIQPDL